MDPKRLQANGLLLFIAAIWGTTFVAVKMAVADIPPFTFNAIRFTIALLSLLFFYPKFRHDINAKAIGLSLLTGLFVFGGYSLQTIGLQFTTASKAAFITGLSVVMVPGLMATIQRQRPPWQLVLGVISATIGLGLLTFNSPGELNLVINIGDLLVLGSAVCFALHIVAIGFFTHQVNTFLFVTGQIATVAFISSIIGWAGEGFPLILTGDVIMALLVTAIPATTLAFLFQNWAQKRTSPSNTAIILATEPVFALVFAFFLLKEPIGAQELIGGGLMLAGMLIADLMPQPPAIPDQQTPGN